MTHDKWKDDAECIGMGDIMQGGPSAKNWGPAAQVCARCKANRPTIHTACAEASKTESAGMWAGTTPLDRGFKTSGKPSPIRVFCRTCGDPFHTSIGNQVTCSHRCSDIYRGRTPKATP